MLLVTTMIGNAGSVLAADEISFKIADTRFDCKESILGNGSGFEKCELYALLKFSAPVEAVLRAFGHCEGAIKYKKKGGLLDDTHMIFEKFDAAIVDGSGLAQITAYLKPFSIERDPILSAKVTNFSCQIDETYQ